jgi:Uncharacterized conserved protein
MKDSVVAPSERLSAPATLVLCEQARAELRRLAMASEGLQNDSGDVSALRRLRVGLRRVGSLLADGSGRIDGLPADSEQLFAKSARSLGRLRDLDILREAVAELLPGSRPSQRFGLRALSLAVDERRASLARVRVPRALRRLASAMHTLETLLDAIEPEGGGAPYADLVVAATEERRRRFHDRLLSLAGGRADAEMLHALRREARELRYRLAPLRKAEPAVPAIVEALLQLQQVLGEWRDAEICAAALPRLAARLARDRQRAAVEAVLATDVDGQSSQRLRRVLAREQVHPGLLRAARQFAIRRVATRVAATRAMSGGDWPALDGELARLVARLALRGSAPRLPAALS